MNLGEICDEHPATVIQHGAGAYSRHGPPDGAPSLDRSANALGGIYRLNTLNEGL